MKVAPMDRIACRDDPASQMAPVVLRWKNFDRHGRQVSQTVVMTVETWAAITDKEGMDAYMDEGRTHVMVVCPMGWTPPLTP